MTCPIAAFARISNYEALGIISRKQADDLKHLSILMEEALVVDALDRLKAEYDIKKKPSQEKLIKYRRAKNG